MQSFAAITKPRAPSRHVIPIDRAGLLLVAMGFVSVLLFAATLARFGHTTFTVDAHLYYIHAHSWYFDHDLDYANNIAADPTFTAREIYAAQHGETGRAVNIFPCGWSMVTLPFLVLADFATILHNAVSSTPLTRDGFTGYYRVIIPLGHLALGWIGLWAGLTLAARYFSRHVATIATLIVWAGTNVCYFMAVEPTMSHAASLCFVSLTLLITDTVHRTGWTLRRALALGASVGMMCAVRHQDAAWVLTPLVLLGKLLFRMPNGPPPRRGGDPGEAPAHGFRCARLKRAALHPSRRAGTTVRPAGAKDVSRPFAYIALALAIAALCLVPQVLVNVAIHGTPVGGVAPFAPDWLHPRFVRDLLALPGGLFVLFPLTLAAMVGWGWWLKKGDAPHVAKALFVGFAACVYINACGIEGTSRRFVCAAPIFILGLCALWPIISRRRWMRRWGVGVVTGLVVKNALLIVGVHLGWVDRFLFTSVISELTPLFSALTK